jgi:hypothetical protein
MPHIGLPLKMAVPRVYLCTYRRSPSRSSAVRGYTGPASRPRPCGSGIWRPYLLVIIAGAQPASSRLYFTQVAAVLQTRVVCRQRRGIIVNRDRAMTSNEQSRCSSEKVMAFLDQCEADVNRAEPSRNTTSALPRSTSGKRDESFPTLSAPLHG